MSQLYNNGALLTGCLNFLETQPRVASQGMGSKEVMISAGREAAPGEDFLRRESWNECSLPFAFLGVLPCIHDFRRRTQCEGIHLQSLYFTLNSDNVLGRELLSHQDSWRPGWVYLSSDTKCDQTGRTDREMSPGLVVDLTECFSNQNPQVLYVNFVIYSSLTFMI